MMMDFMAVLTKGSIGSFFNAAKWITKCIARYVAGHVAGHVAGYVAERVCECVSGCVSGYVAARVVRCVAERDAGCVAKCVVKRVYVARRRVKRMVRRLIKRVIERMIMRVREQVVERVVEVLPGLGSEGSVEFLAHRIEGVVELARRPNNGSWGIHNERRRGVSRGRGKSSRQEARIFSSCGLGKRARGCWLGAAPS